MKCLRGESVFSSHEFNVILKWLLRIYLVILKGVFTNLFSDIKGSVHEMKVFFFSPEFNVILKWLLRIYFVILKEV